MFHFLRRLSCFIGNHMPRGINSYFYKIAGVKFNLSKVEIGNRCHLDTMFPENIEIRDHVCISFDVKIIAHFESVKGIKDHPIKRYKKKIIIEEGVYVGPASIIMPGIKLKKNTFVHAGTVVTKSTDENSFIYGNPQVTKLRLDKKKISLINKTNEKFRY